MSAPQFAHVRWRVGRKVGRTIYAQMEDVPSDYDALIGVMDSPDLARQAVAAHNRVLTDSPQRGDASGEDGVGTNLAGFPLLGSTDAPRCTCKFGASGSHADDCPNFEPPHGGSA